jgi:hypothetical protein
VFTWNPRSTHPEPGQFDAVSANQLNGVWCISATECFTGNNLGLYGSSDPGGGSFVWPMLIADTPAGTVGVGILGVSCPSTSRCVAVDGEGYTLIGSPPATGSQIRSMLRTLIPARKVTRAALRRGYDLSVDMPSGGEIILTWVGRYHGRQRTIATATTSTSNAGLVRLKIRLTRIGRNLTRSTNRIHLTAENSFLPLDGTTTTYAVSRQFTVSPVR